MRRLVSALIILGIIFVLPTVFAQIATILAIIVVLIIMWQKLTEIWALQQLIYEEVKRRK
jgi:hypothetical protein